MAVKLHMNMPSLSQIVFFEYRTPEDLSQDSETLVQLTETTPSSLQSYLSESGDEWRRLKDIYARRGWKCPELKFMECLMYKRGFTDVLTAWDEYELVA